MVENEAPSRRRGVRLDLEFLKRRPRSLDGGQLRSLAVERLWKHRSGPARVFFQEEWDAARLLSLLVLGISHGRLTARCDWVAALAELVAKRMEKKKQPPTSEQVTVTSSH